MLDDIQTLTDKKILTARQLEVLELLEMGYDRKQVAKSLYPPVVVQAIHQIVLRIRKRLKIRAKMNVKTHTVDAKLISEKKKRTGRRKTEKGNIYVKCYECGETLKLSRNQKLKLYYAETHFFHKACAIKHKLELNAIQDDFYNKKEEFTRLVV